MSELILFKSSDFKVTIFPYSLRFKYPFKLASGTRSHTDIVILKIVSGDYTVYGEAALPPYLGATVASTTKFLESLDWQSLLGMPLTDAIELIDKSGVGSNAAKAAVDIALHDIEAKRRNQTLGQFYNVSSEKNVITTYTIGISNEKELRAKLKEAAGFKIIKLKLGSEDDIELIKSFRKLTKKSFCVDVNQGYKTRDKAAAMSELLLKNGVLFVEQPMLAEHFEEMAWVRERVDVPFIADESVKRLKDLNQAAEAFDGVNIKLMKSSGLSEAFEMISHSRKLNLRVVLGAMAESSLGNTAAAHLAPLADWVDLDGPMLTSNDPFNGLSYSNGEIIMPDRVGVGAFPAVDESDTLIFTL